MIDFIKLNSHLTSIERKQLKNNIDFFGTYNTATGELVSLSSNGKQVLNHIVAWEKNMKIKLYPSGWCEVSGSIHKYFNDGKHNFNQFEKSNLIESVSLLSDKLKVNLRNFKISGLEVGVNIKPPIDSQEIIANSLLYKSRPFESKYHNDEGNYKQVSLSEYRVKLYDKRLHYEAQGYEVGEETMRFEIKYNSMRSVKQKGIFLLEDLEQKIECLKEPLLNAWDKVLFFDPSINKKKNNEKNIRCSNINYWMELKKKSTRTFNYQFNKFKKYTKENTCGIQAQVRDIMRDTLDALV